MSYESPYQQRPASQNTYILDFKLGDVNGDGVPDSVYLVGNKTSPDEIFADNVSIVIKDGRTHNMYRIPLANAGGYKSQLFLGSFTSMKKNDILVSIDTGGSGGYILAYLYTILGNHSLLLFDSESFGEKSIFDATFKDNFRVQIRKTHGNIEFMIDVSSNKKMYVDAGVYNEQGKLLKPTVGGVLALGALYPLVSSYDGLFHLLAYQRIIGINNSDNLRALQTYLKWNGSFIGTERVEVSIMPSSPS